MVPQWYQGGTKGFTPQGCHAFDSVSYDAILDYKAALDEAKAEYAKGQLPPVSDSYINKAVAAYNVAETLYKLYHGGATDKAQELQDAVAAFGKAIADLRTQFGGK